MTGPSYPSRRSISAAAKPAAPPPTTTTDAGFAETPATTAAAFAVPVTYARPPRSSTAAGRNGIEGRSADRLARLGSKAGVVPWAAHDLAIEEAVGERAAVVGALAAEGVDPAGPPDEHDRFAVDAPSRHRAFGEIRERHAVLAEVRSG